VYAERYAKPDTPGLSQTGQPVLPLLTALDSDEAEEALQRLPPPLQERLTAISPTTYLHDIHARLIVLLHDRDDPVIPVDESRRLRDALASDGRVRYTEFTVFRHLDPTKGNPSPALARELVRFGRAIYPLFGRAAA
jgi:dipeptidyl aminopeptidase/acylaminoacyl peptidase